MIWRRISRPVRVLLLCGAAFAVAALTAACGTERITVAASPNSLLYHGAVLFSQRCSGCHTLNEAGARGSAANPRIAQSNSGPNFNVRCERPVTRVLYAIENGGFSGAYMPQNIVVGQDAADVAKFVSTYAGRLSPKLTGVTPCQQLSVGTLPVALTAPTATTAQTTSPSASATTAAAAPAGKAKAKRKRTHA